MRLAALALTAFWYAPPVDVALVELQPKTAAAYEDYLHRREQAEVVLRERSGRPFLWADASAERRNLIRQGEIVVEPVVGDGDTEIADGLIHDWNGAAFLPGVTLAQTLTLIEDYNRHKEYYQPEVRDSRLLSRHGDDFQVYLRVLKKQVLTVVLDTIHDVRYTCSEPARCTSRSHTTRIAEVENPGTARERQLPPGKDHGFMWRFDSWWRFEERDGGVWIECEAISLTRSVPVGLGWLVNPIIHTLPRESLGNALRETRAALTRVNQDRNGPH
jgi:hypothetical protein